MSEWGHLFSAHGALYLAMLGHVAAQVALPVEGGVAAGIGAAEGLGLSVQLLVAREIAPLEKREKSERWTAESLKEAPAQLEKRGAAVGSAHGVDPNFPSLLFVSLVFCPLSVFSLSVSFSLSLSCNCLIPALVSCVASAAPHLGKGFAAAGKVAGEELPAIFTFTGHLRGWLLRSAQNDFFFPVDHRFKCFTQLMADNM